MLASLKGSLVPTKNSLPQYCHRYLANTYINKQGCFHLSQAHWRELVYLRLGIKNIMQEEIISRMGDVNTWLMLNGRY